MGGEDIDPKGGIGGLTQPEPPRRAFSGSTHFGGESGEADAEACGFRNCEGCCLVEEVSVMDDGGAGFVSDQPDVDRTARVSMKGDIHDVGVFAGHRKPVAGSHGDEPLTESGRLFTLAQRDGGDLTGAVAGQSEVISAAREQEREDHAKREPEGFHGGNMRNCIRAGQPLLSSDAV